MIDIVDKEKCSGCTACYTICPQSCISMEKDNEGFLYPKVEFSKCIHCNLCEKVCPFIERKVSLYESTAFACINKNYEDKYDSSSGGIFILLAKYIINQGGVVYGAAFNERYQVHHIFVDTVDDLKKLQGSKYVQSNIKGVFEDVKHNLVRGRLVLFTGTPCQIDGLLQYLGKNYTNLITQDVVCHGVPSEYVWMRYLKENKDVNEKEIIKINFRDKKKSWKDFYISIISESKIYQKHHYDDVFMQSFLTDMSIRPSCYRCVCKGIKRSSDITLADFWNIEKLDKSMFDENGTSLVLVNSEKGKMLINKIKKDMLIKEENIDEVIKYNLAMIQSVSKPRFRFLFYKKLKNHTIEESLRYALHPNICLRIMYKIKATLK